MKLTLPEGKFEALLFDLDGTIANSLPLHYEAWQEALRPHGASMPEDLFYAWGGIPVPRTVEMLNETFSWQLPITEVTYAREQAYHARILEVKTHPEVEAIIRQHRGKLPMAVVSGSARAVVESTLKRLGLWEMFDAIVGAEDCKEGKPHPEPFLTGARLLSVSPSACLACEDAEPGIRSALSAGMQVVRIPQRPA